MPTRRDARPRRRARPGTTGRSGSEAPSWGGRRWWSRRRPEAGASANRASGTWPSWPTSSGCTPHRAPCSGAMSWPPPSGAGAAAPQQDGPLREVLDGEATGRLGVGGGAAERRARAHCAARHRVGGPVPPRRRQVTRRGWCGRRLLPRHRPQRAGIEPVPRAGRLPRRASRPSPQPRHDEAIRPARVRPHRSSPGRR